jgi:hypothetical protein
LTEASNISRQIWAWSTTLAAAAMIAIQVPCCRGTANRFVARAARSVREGQIRFGSGQSGLILQCFLYKILKMLHKMSEGRKSVQFGHDVPMWGEFACFLRNSRLESAVQACEKGAS